MNLSGRYLVVNGKAAIKGGWGLRFAATPATQSGDFEVESVGLHGRVLSPLPRIVCGIERSNYKAGSPQTISGEKGQDNATSKTRPLAPLPSFFTQLPSLLDHLVKLLNACFASFLFGQSGDQLRQCLQVDGFSQRFSSQLCGQQSGGSRDAE